MYDKTIYIVGDSTVEDGRAPFFGWGGQLARLLPDSIRVVNGAKSGRSSKSFRDEGLFDPICREIRARDLLLIQFGHNDEKDDAARHTDPDDTFPESLSLYMDAAESAGATPVLITSVSRCFFTDDGSLMYTHGEYPRAVRELARLRGAPLIDLHAATRALLIRLGAEESKSLFVNVEPGEYPELPDGWHDKTHFNMHGAQTVAELAASALRDLKLI
ncbi:MAG: rhamnogalacturonan acetylesterase [Oscillospiraceae bacterium]|jgi:lysophospholipase L1-like esterase|nr:rhamnogalacturonan acetylesterase [Oscillospiraceae bacterium]